MKKLSFNPKQVVAGLLSVLQDRSRDIVERRFGLVGKSGERMTLEAIGGVYDITRERVRQIENAAFVAIRKSEEYEGIGSVMVALEDAMIEHGGLVREDIFLDELSLDVTVQNAINFLMVLGESFIHIKEDDNFHRRWTTDEGLSNSVHEALYSLHDGLSGNDLISDDDMLIRFLDILKGKITDAIEDVKARHWMDISKRIAANPLGEWGLANSPNIRARGMRDYAYLVLRDSGEPLHFTDVAKNIETKFNKKAHVATCHNELIKDNRFVLVGRGQYALSEWGFANGIVRDVIKGILKKGGALSKDEIVERVLKERRVKANTVYVNLQNSKHFKKDKAGKYSLV